MPLFLLLMLSLSSSSKDFQSLNRQILMQTIGHESAKKKFKKIISAVKEGCKSHVFIQEPEPVFPLTGYDTNSISKTALIDYRDKGYDFFTGNAHLGHPGIDLNIIDSDRDGLDDNLKKTVKVVSMTEGIVVDIEEKWKPESLVNDGNFILVYDFVNHQLVYYAHLGKVLVDVGDIVGGGTPLGFVGRTGAIGRKPTSPTHLHLMLLKLSEDNLPTPINPITFLKSIENK